MHPEVRKGRDAIDASIAGRYSPIARCGFFRASAITTPSAPDDVEEGVRAGIGRQHPAREILKKSVHDDSDSPRDEQQPGGNTALNAQPTLIARRSHDHAT
jgi:hypothetical protein